VAGRSGTTASTRELDAATSLHLSPPIKHPNSRSPFSLKPEHSTAISPPGIANFGSTARTVPALLIYLMSLRCNDKRCLCAIQ
jgi:hypothetical protein